MATFSYPPYYVFEYTTDHNVLVSTFESGREQRRYKGKDHVNGNSHFDRHRAELIASWSSLTSVKDLMKLLNGLHQGRVRQSEFDLKLIRLEHLIKARCLLHVS